MSTQIYRAIALLLQEHQPHKSQTIQYIDRVDKGLVGFEMVSSRLKSLFCIRSYKREVIRGAASRCPTWRAVHPTPAPPPPCSAAVRDPPLSRSRNRSQRPRGSNLNSRWSHPPTRGPAAAAEISNSNSSSSPSDVDDEAGKEIHCESIIGRRPTDGGADDDV